MRLWRGKGKRRLQRELLRLRGLCRARLKRAAGKGPAERRMDHRMNERFRISGGVRLEGVVSVSGGKNAALAIMPAALLADSPSTIENIPDINDVRVVIEMLRWLGAIVDYRDNTMWIDPRNVDKYNPPEALASRMRASYYFAPVLLGMFGRAEVPLPGGCDIGARPIDQTVKGMETLGAKVSTWAGLPLRVSKVSGGTNFAA